MCNDSSGTSFGYIRIKSKELFLLRFTQRVLIAKEAKDTAHISRNLYGARLENWGIRCKLIHSRILEVHKNN